MHALAPLLVRQADHRHVLDRRMGTQHGLDLGGVDVLAAGDDHVALAVDEVDVALGIAAGHVAHRAVVAAEGRFRLVRELPVAVEGVGVAGVELAGLAVRYFVAVGVHHPDRGRAHALPADRAQLRELLVRAEHGDPAGLARAVELEQARAREHLHHGALRVRPRRCRGDHQLLHPAKLEVGPRGRGHAQHHDVVGGYQRGEGRAALGQGPQAVLGVEALARVDVGRTAAIEERAEEVERVGMTHRHDQECCVLAVERELDLGDEREQDGRLVAAHHTLGLAGGARRVHQRPGIGECHLLLRLTVARRRDQLLVGAVAGRAGTPAHVDQVARRHRQIGPDLLDQAQQIVLDDQGPRFRVLDGEEHLGPDQPEVDRHRDQAGLGGGGINLRPLDPVVGQHRHPVALDQAQAQQRVGKPARAPVPLPEAHRAVEVSGPGPAAIQPRMHRQHLAKGQKLHHADTSREPSLPDRAAWPRLRTWPGYRDVTAMCGATDASTAAAKPDQPLLGVPLLASLFP